MSRKVPWRNKPTHLISQMLPVASQYKLYLVHETGPTSFVFKDDNDNKFKVSIGFTISCSCGIVQNDHCIHTLYVMLKKFQVPATNPIIWQASYLDSELEGLMHFKYAERLKVPKQKISHFKKHTIQPTNSESQEFPALEEDAMCPICYEEMVGQCYSSCGVCAKSVHTKCFKVWTKHKQDSGMPVTCPMCRSAFSNPLIMIYKDQQKWQARFSTHKGTVCKGCGIKNIKGLLYKCLICANTDLCKMCYEGNQHLEHDRFFVKELATDVWKSAPIRIKKTKKQLFQPIKQLNVRELPDILETQFILGLFPSLKDYNSAQSINQLGIVGNDILSKQICQKCKTIGSESMKKLTCGHTVHEECLKQMISKKQFLCDFDNEPICPGYLTAMGIKIVKKKKPLESVLLKNQQEIIKITANINHLEINGFVPKVKVEEGFATKVKVEDQKRNKSVAGNGLMNNKSKDKNFRIMKKTIQEKRNQDQLSFGTGHLGMMMITGLGQNNQMVTGMGQNNQTQHSSMTHQNSSNSHQYQNNVVQNNNFPPRMRTNNSNRLGQR